MTLLRHQIRVQGIVQGVGFRPFIYREATSLGLSGFVRNGGDGVTIEAQGSSASLEIFVQRIELHHPPQASIRDINVTSLAPVEESSFCIVESTQSDASPSLPADLSMCADCRAEVLSAKERRYRYPFTNCTNCGPRYTIVEALPYDRPLTSMKGFPLCAACGDEYHDPLDRRFHAQPIACPACGPSLQLLLPSGSREDSGGDALRRTSKLLRDGCIIAMQGLGGFQLLVNAQDPAAVQRLRDRKHREEKPFALLLSSMEEARHYCKVSDEEATQLNSPEAPIILLRRLDELSLPGVAPHHPYLGVMLAYTPLHIILLNETKLPLVCTSGNLSEEPMCINHDEAFSRLRDIADYFLIHDRPIVRPVDDSVGINTSSGFSLLRRARGFAPRPQSLPVSREAPVVLSLGGHLKNTITLTVEDQAITSQHIGDLQSPESVALLRRTVADLTSFFQKTPARIACDLHPDYASTRIAEELSLGRKLPLIRVQHHHAHLAACAAEHRFVGEALGFAWDGTGLGTDDTIWGGEVLWYRGASFTRVAHLLPFRLPGGERAARDPRRCALGLLDEAFGEDCHTGGGRYPGRALNRYPSLGFTASEYGLLSSLIKKKVQAPVTTSMGRLFDGVAAILLGASKQSYEGQAAMQLEFACADTDEEYPISIVDKSPSVIDWRPMIRALLVDIKRGVSVGACSAKFHNSLCSVAIELSQRFSSEVVLFGGGCFQNQRLRSTLHQKLITMGRRPLFPQKFPVNDGGLSLGQALIALGDFLCA